MKRLITMTILATLIAAPVHAIEMEEGATFNGGRCVEADGTPGLSSGTGECVTAADYDEAFSFENLSQTQTLTPGSEMSIAEEAGLVDSGVASDRQLGDGVLAETRTFKERLWWHIGGIQ